MRTSLTGSMECLDLQPGMQGIASRLETTRMAAYMGATTELRKEEGITYDIENETLYLAMSAVERGMEDDHSNDAGGPNHIRLPENDCGVVYALPVGSDGAVGSRYVAQRIIGVVAGAPIEGDANNSCSLDGIANPDNVAFMDGHGILIIGEDTGSGHQNDIIWAYDVYAGSLTRIQTTPYGSETTSPYWYPDINGWAYLKSVIQHPFGESDRDQLMSDDEAAAYDGYIGPFPSFDDL
jgi:secreted PhoX family phosphatase